MALTLINQVEAMSIARAAAALGLPRTTAERILNTLAADGYLERSTIDKQYRLTPKVLALSSGFSGESWVTHVAAPMLNRLTEEIGWPLAIATAEGTHMHVRYTTDTMTSLWIYRRRVGASISILKASSGTVHLAFVGEAERTQLQLALERESTDHPIDWSGVDEARANGYAFSPQDTREQSISLPIFLDGKLAAVLLMIFMARVHSHQTVVEQYLPRLTALARAIGESASLSSHGEQAAGEAA